MAQTTSTATSAPPSKESLLSIARSRLANAYKASSSRPGISAVSFQPLLTRPNQDRVATLSWSIGGQRWLFLAVCDGMPSLGATSIKRSANQDIQVTLAQQPQTILLAVFPHAFIPP